MKKLIGALGVLLGLLVVSPGTSAAGGWVIVSLDSVPSFAAGDRTDVGFTVLRHGVSPESSDSIVVVLTARDGEEFRFDAVAEGAVGHHVVTIDVPDVDAFSWKVVGEFLDVGLGSVDLATDVAGSDTTWTWDALQWATAAFAVAMGCLAGHDFLRSRRLARSAAAA